jgi:hypothetical protein
MASGNPIMEGDKMKILFKGARVIDGKGETWEDGFITIE